jgi:GNAT superfamily N-acetyltransferase
LVTARATAVTVRRASPDDVPHLVELRRLWSSENLGRELEADADFVTEFAAWFEREADQRVSWIAEVEGAPIGMLNMLVFTRMPVPSAARRSRPSQWGYIANVFVRAEHRNDGSGRALLDAAIAHADTAGFARLVLSPSERSIPFYGRAGFAPAATTLMVRPAPPGEAGRMHRTS